VTEQEIFDHLDKATNIIIGMALLAKDNKSLSDAIQELDIAMEALIDKWKL